MLGQYNITSVSLIFSTSDRKISDSSPENRVLKLLMSTNETTYCEAKGRGFPSKKVLKRASEGRMDVAVNFTGIRFIIIYIAVCNSSNAGR